MSFPILDWPELSLQLIITLGHFLWQACVVAIVFVIAEQAVTFLSGRAQAIRFGESKEQTPDGLRRSANVRYTLASLAFFSLPLCVMTTFAWVHQARGSVFLLESAPVESPAYPEVIAYTSSPRFAAETPLLLPIEMAAVIDSPIAEPLELPNDAVPTPSRTERIDSLAPYLLIAYAIGVGFMLTRFGVSIVGSSRLRRTVQPITDSQLLKIIADQSSRIGLKRIPVVSLCQRVSVPMVVGIIKPMILFPPALLCGLDPNQLAAVLSHEMAHIRRYDPFVNLLQRILESLLFFHPVTWWISRRVSIERENCCDDMAAAGCGRFEYAAALLRMAERCASARGLNVAPQLQSLAADGGNVSQLGHRIRRLLGDDHTPRISLTRSAVAAIASVAILGFASVVAVAQPVDDNALKSQPVVAQSTGGDLRSEMTSAEEPSQVSDEAETNPATSTQDGRPDKQTIEKVLDGTTSVRYIDQPLSSVLADIAKKHAITLKMDVQVVKARPNSPTLPISIELKDVSLRSALRLLLRTHKLEYINEGSRLLVITSEYAETAHREQRYAIPKLIANHAYAFVTAIRETILINESMGTAKIERDELVVRAPRAARATIGKLVEQFQPRKDAGESAAPREIDRILQQPAELKFVFTPLPDAMRQISMSHGIRILVDRKALERAGISPDVAITFELKGVDLGRSLRFLLNTCNLSYIVKDEYVQVTTKETDDAHREIAVHTLPSAAEPLMTKILPMLIKRNRIAWTTGNNRIVAFKNHFVVYGTRPAQMATEQFVDNVTRRMGKAQVHQNERADVKKKDERLADPFSPGDSSDESSSDPFSGGGDRAPARKAQISSSKKNGIISSLKSEREAIIRLHGEDHPSVKRLDAQVAAILKIPVREHPSNDISKMSPEELRRDIHMLRQRVEVLESRFSNSKDNLNQPQTPQK